MNDSFFISWDMSNDEKKAFLEEKHRKEEEEFKEWIKQKENDNTRT